MKTEVYLVWNRAQNECVGFTDPIDALFAATGDHNFSEGFGVSTLADDFRGTYYDEAGEPFTITKSSSGEEVDILQLTASQ